MLERNEDRVTGGTPTTNQRLGRYLPTDTPHAVTPHGGYAAKVLNYAAYYAPLRALRNGGGALRILYTHMHHHAKDTSICWFRKLKVNQGCR